MEPAFDAVVVGAGPAGISTAMHLTRSDRRVVVLDKARFPRDKCCGDGLTTGALRELERLGFDCSTVANWQPIGSAWIRSPRGFEVEFPFPVGHGLFGAVAPRRDLDAALVRLARSRGVEIREDVAVTSLAEYDSTVVVGTSTGDSITTRFVVGADGMWSPTRRLAGLSEAGHLGEWHAFRQYATNVTGSAADRLWVWFDADLLPGYAWSFPLPGGRANVGFGVARDNTRTGRDLKQIWAGLIDRPHIRAALGPDAVFEERHLAWPIPARIDTAPAGRGRVLR